MKQDSALSTHSRKVYPTLVPLRYTLIMQMQALFHCVATADPITARVNLETLPDQLLMEMTVQDLKPHTKKYYFEDKAVEYKPIEEWKGLTFDKSGNVVVITWMLANLSGTMSFDTLPRNLKALTLNGNNLYGTLDTAKFPKFIRRVNLQQNRFSGTVDFALFPDSMVMIDLALNQFSGDVAFAHLPKNLRDLNLNRNYFGGSVDLTALPSGLESLHLNYNSFEGSIDLSKLPKTLVTINLYMNKLTGVLDSLKLSENVELEARENNFDTKPHLE